MSGDTDEFREDDVYDMASWWFVATFVCQRCECVFEGPSDLHVQNEDDDRYFHAVAVAAKRAGWAVTTAKNEKEVYVVCCDRCHATAKNTES
jgi:hypothetical protein